MRPESMDAGIATSQPAAPAPRPLTYDEKKAAEAAFQGMPFNPEWSDAARKVYDGILLAMGERQLAALGETDLEAAYAR
ncbi:MAG: hypothetical protein U0172_06460 [Nitrospiraceae bacterium]